MKRKLWAKSPNNPNELSIWTKKNYQYLVVARSGSPRGGIWFEEKSKALKRADFLTKKFQYENGDNKFIVVSCNTEQQWACKFDDWLQNEYEFTQEEVDELQADRKRQVRRETSQKTFNRRDA